MKSRFTAQCLLSWHLMFILLMTNVERLPQTYKNILARLCSKKVWATKRQTTAVRVTLRSDCLTWWSYYIPLSWGIRHPKVMFEQTLDHSTCAWDSFRHQLSPANSDRVFAALFSIDRFVANSSGLLIVYRTASCDDFHSGTLVVCRTVMKKKIVTSAKSATGNARSQNSTL